MMATGTTRPSRARTTPAKATAAKPAAAKSAPAKAPAGEAAVQTVDRFTVEFEHHGTTKNFERFDAPNAMKGVVVGSVYAPIGTGRVAVLVVQAAPASAEEGAEA